MDDKSIQLLAGIFAASLVIGPRVGAASESTPTAGEAFNFVAAAEADPGAKFEVMLKLGQSKTWPEALAAFSGEHDIDASAIIDYFAPLSAWLDKQNPTQACQR